MYANKDNILQLIDLLMKADINYIVLCPGSRNAPLIHTFASLSFFKCFQVTDERSAGFFAIGLSLKLHKPVAVCCTSGTALLNLSSAVAESYYQHIPLLVISADRPLAWIGQMDGQTLPQHNAFNSLVRKSVQLPEPQNNTDRWFCNRLINEALLELSFNQPVHINIPISEPFFDFSAENLPNERYIQRTYAQHITLPDSLLQSWKSAKAPTIVIGQGEYSIEIVQSLKALALKCGCVIFAEHLGNIDNDFIFRNFDDVIYSEPDLIKPDFILYFGGHIVSKHLKKFLRSAKPSACWRISTDGTITDTFQNLTQILVGSIIEIVHILANTQITSPYYEYWKKCAETTQKKTDSYCFNQFSDLYVWKMSSCLIPPKSSIHLANSSTVRNSQLFDFSDDITFFCNRGTSGIDGSLSTAIGYASIHQGLTFCIIGDLSFFYDMNALWNNHLSPSIRILLINNGGGQIFHHLPSLQSEHLTKYIAAEHQTHAEGWAKSTGCIYLKATNKNTFKANLDTFFSEKSESPIVFEIITQEEINQSVFKEYYQYVKTK